VGPETGVAVFTGSNGRNTVSIRRSAWVVIRGFELDGLGRYGDGVKLEGESDNWGHHITLEDLTIHDHDASSETGDVGTRQLIVGINTKAEAWNWVLRRNVITRTGTGMYLGDSDGDEEFVGGLVEHNLITETIGYNVQIKHQENRSTELGLPAAATNVVRHNVFSKASGSSSGGLARPNLLVGHMPASGPGTEDDTLVYGNLFWHNETGNEALLQAEGNVIVYDNLFVNDFGDAVLVQPHNDLPRRVRVFQNTVLAQGTGIFVSTDVVPGSTQRVIGNAVFAADPIDAAASTVLDNVTASRASAATDLANPNGAISGPTDRLDLSPLAGQLDGTAIDLSGLSTYEDWNRDFDGNPRPGTVRGAYARPGPPNWLPALERKPEPTIFSDGFESGDTGRWSSVSP
jgi:hypothetical protein